MLCVAVAAARVGCSRVVFRWVGAQPLGSRAMEKRSGIERGLRSKSTKLASVDDLTIGSLHRCVCVCVCVCVSSFFCVVNVLGRLTPLPTPQTSVMDVDEQGTSHLCELSRG